MKVKGRLLRKWKGKRKGEGKLKRVKEGVNMIKVHYVHVWK
jgi:hypothetical protein